MKDARNEVTHTLIYAACTSTGKTYWGKKSK